MPHTNGYFANSLQSDTQVRLKEELVTPLRQLQETARRIAKVSNESGIAIVEDEYVQSFKIEMMDVVLQWCKGAKFSEICKLTDVFEGSVIRCFRRLQELLRQMGMAAGAIGNTELEEKFAKSLEMLERPNTVVFNPSYVDQSNSCGYLLTCLDFTCNPCLYLVFCIYALHDLAVLTVSTLSRPLDFDWDICFRQRCS
jgi:hypothetical protein